MKLVYVAGPYTSPDPIENTNTAIRIADDLYHDSHGLIVPIIPHLTAFWHLVRPHEYSYWLSYDLKVMSRCDAVFRWPGPSTGADGEVADAVRQGIPVFTTIEGLMRWAEQSEARDALPA
jgi:hypothetical protein